MTSPEAIEINGPSRQRVLWTVTALSAMAVVTIVFIAVAVRANGDDLKAVVGLAGASILLATSTFEVGRTVAGHDAETRRLRDTLEKTAIAQTDAARVEASLSKDADEAEREAGELRAEVIRLRAAAVTSVAAANAVSHASLAALESADIAVRLRSSSQTAAQLALISSNAVVEARSQLCAAVRAGTRRSIVWSALLSGAAMAVMPDLIDSIVVLVAD